MGPGPKSPDKKSVLPKVESEHQSPYSMPYDPESEGIVDTSPAPMPILFEIALSIL